MFNMFLSTSIVDPKIWNMIFFSFFFFFFENCSYKIWKPKSLNLETKDYSVILIQCLLKKFEKYKLKITVHDCIEQNLYHVDYWRGVDGGNGPLHLVIPEFYCHVK